MPPPQGSHYIINTEELFGSNLGMISAQKLEEAFDSEANFFILSPKKDSEGRSTRQILLQRALASLGLYYEYHDREGV